MTASLRRILLAEDDLNDAELTLTALKDHGIVNPVDVVNDGPAVLEYLRKQGPFTNRDNGLPVLVLLDIKMPKMDGIEVLRVIKGDSNLQMLPVVMLTSSREERDLLESYRLGVNGYVVKPVDFHQFVDAVTQLGLFWAAINEPPPEQAAVAKAG